MRVLFGIIGIHAMACQSEASKEMGSLNDEETPVEDTATDPSGTEVPPIEDCPEGVECFNQFPVVLEGDTRESSLSQFNSYSCAPSTDESGPEQIYRLTLLQSGFLALELSGMNQDVDIDIHLLGSNSADDCIDRGHWRAGDYLEAGDYWVVADTWVNASGDEKSGAFTLSMGFTAIDDLQEAGMASDFAEDVLHAYGVAWAKDEAGHFKGAFTDFSLHSAERRFWLWDMLTGSALAQLHVAHGENTSATDDPAWSEFFSNTNNSHQSSLGVMVAGETYTGTYGYSMRIDGLENGYNDLVRSRAIVMHPWEGSRPEYVDYHGMVAPTWGCPGIDDRESDDVIDALSEGGVMVFWYPDNDWSTRSTYLP